MTIGDTPVAVLLTHHDHEIGAGFTASRFICAFGRSAQQQAIAWLHLVQCVPFMEVELALQDPDPVAVECVRGGGKARSRACWQLNTHEIERKIRLRRNLSPNVSRLGVLPTWL